MATWILVLSMTLKAGKIEAFPEQQLLPQVRRVLQGVSHGERVELEKQPGPVDKRIDLEARRAATRFQFAASPLSILS